MTVEYDIAVASCPTPVYHETHRYCPSCPWTERGPIESITQVPALADAMAADAIAEQAESPTQHSKAWRFPTDDGSDYGILVECGPDDRPHWWLLCPATATLYLDTGSGTPDLLDCHDGDECNYLDDVHAAAHAFLAERLAP